MLLYLFCRYNSVQYDMSYYCPLGARVELGLTKKNVKKNVKRPWTFSLMSDKNSSSSEDLFDPKDNLLQYESDGDFNPDPTQQLPESESDKDDKESESEKESESDKDDKESESENEEGDFARKKTNASRDAQPKHAPKTNTRKKTNASRDAQPKHAPIDGEAVDEVVDEVVDDDGPGISPSMALSKPMLKALMDVQTANPYLVDLEHLVTFVTKSLNRLCDTETGLKPAERKKLFKKLANSVPVNKRNYAKFIARKNTNASRDVQPKNAQEPKSHLSQELIEEEEELQTLSIEIPVMSDVPHTQAERAKMVAVMAGTMIRAFNNPSEIATLPALTPERVAGFADALQSVVTGTTSAEDTAASLFRAMYQSSNAGRTLEELMAYIEDGVRLSNLNTNGFFERACRLVTQAVQDNEDERRNVRDAFIRQMMDDGQEKSAAVSTWKNIIQQQRRGRYTRMLYEAAGLPLTIPFPGMSKLNKMGEEEVLLVCEYLRKKRIAHEIPDEWSFRPRMLIYNIEIQQGTAEPRLLELSQSQPIPPERSRSPLQRVAVSPVGESSIFHQLNEPSIRDETSRDALHKTTPNLKRRLTNIEKAEKAQESLRKRRATLAAKKAAAEAQAEVKGGTSTRRAALAAKKAAADPLANLRAACAIRDADAAWQAINKAMHALYPREPLVWDPLFSQDVLELLRSVSRGDDDLVNTWIKKLEVARQVVLAGIPSTSTQGVSRKNNK